jgi:hypothetical protein
MGDLGATIGNRTLRNVILPGAHDAGTALQYIGSRVAPDQSRLDYIPYSRSVILAWAKTQGMEIGRHFLSHGSHGVLL